MNFKGQKWKKEKKRRSRSHQFGKSSSRKWWHHDLTWNHVTYSGTSSGGRFSWVIYFGFISVVNVICIVICPPGAVISYLITDWVHMLTLCKWKEIHSLEYEKRKTRFRWMNDTFWLGRHVGGMKDKVWEVNLLDYNVFLELFFPCQLDNPRDNPLFWPEKCTLKTVFIWSSPLVTETFRLPV